MRYLFEVPQRVPWDNKLVTIYFRDTVRNYSERMVKVREEMEEVNKICAGKNVLLVQFSLGISDACKTFYVVTSHRSWSSWVFPTSLDQIALGCQISTFLDCLILDTREIYHRSKLNLCTEKLLGWPRTNLLQQLVQK